MTELKIFDIVNFEDHAAYKVLGVAEYHIKNCFAAFGVRISTMQTYHFLIASVRAA